MTRVPSLSPEVLIWDDVYPPFPPEGLVLFYWISFAKSSIWTLQLRVDSEPRARAEGSWLPDHGWPAQVSRL